MDPGAEVGTAGALFSPDGAWFWSGSQWTPAVSPDGRWRWTGGAWAPVRRRPPTPRWVVRDGLIWLGLFLVWIPVVSALLLNHAPSSVSVSLGVSLGSLSVLATFVFGGLLGRHRRWREFGLAILVGTAGLMVCYVALMVLAPDPNNTNDIGAGAGVVILGLPTLIFVAALLGLGGLVGRITRSVRMNKGAEAAA